MARTRTGILKAEDDYLPDDERKLRAKGKREELKARRLTPDWFTGQKDWVLPPGFRVAIVGGGFAGLAAAWYLQECGARTTVFEAAERIGGRVQTNRSFVPGKTVEVGAELIGENHGMWGILAERYSLPLVRLTEDDVYESGGLDARLRFGGKDLTPDQKQKLAKDLRKPLAAIGAEARTVSETEPWLGDEKLGRDRKSISDGLDGLPGVGKSSSLVRLWFEFTLGNDCCAPIAKQSYLGLLAAVSAGRMGSDPPGMLGYWMSTETHRCHGGNDLLAARLRGKLPDVRLRTHARLIEVRSGYSPPVRVVFSRHDSAGREVELGQDRFHYAILTAPPTVWKDIAFEPRLNAASRTLLEGPAVKFLSRYDSRFWEAAKLAPSAKSDELGSVWEGTDGQLPNPEYDLTVFSGGQYVLPASSYPSAMAKLYPTGKPKAELFVDWPNTPFIMTGEAVPGLGQITTVSRTQIVPHAEYLYFAGEQTSPGFFGYMEGALQSGARAARDIVLRARRPQPRWWEPKL